VALVSLPAFLVLYLLAGDIFGFVFGAEWRQAGVYAAILVPMFYMNFVAMSANGVFVITGNLKASLVWQVVGFILPATGMLFGAVHVGTVEAALVGLCAAKSISFALHMALSYGLAKGRS
jgi:O-antigen/teichoic acid export membrane protein